MQDSLYYCLQSDCTSFLRFYPDGLVIEASVPVDHSSDVEHILTWFNREKINEYVSRGIYATNSDIISFDLKSIDGIVTYNGTIQSTDWLSLNVSSLINGHKAVQKYIRYRRNSNTYQLNYQNQMKHLLQNIQTPPQALVFPPTITSGVLFNKFINAISNQEDKSGLNAFHQFVGSHSKKIENIICLPEKRATKYILSKDIWGPREIFLVVENEDDFDFMVSHVSRTKLDYYTMLEFVKLHSGFIEIEQETRRRMYVLKNTEEIWSNISRLTFTFDREHSQKHDISVLFNLF